MLFNFYVCWDWRFLAPLLLSTSIDSWCATRMEYLIETGRPIDARKPYLVLSLVTNLGLLGFFKYLHFFTNSFEGLLTRFGFHPSLWTIRVILRIGISFYTFQALSYTIDVYRMLASLFHPSEFDVALAWKMFSFALPLILVQMVQYTTKTPNFLKWSWFIPKVQALAYSILLYFVLFRGGRPESFIYF